MSANRKSKGGAKAEAKGKKSGVAHSGKEQPPRNLFSLVGPPLVVVAAVLLYYFFSRSELQSAAPALSASRNGPIDAANQQDEQPSASSVTSNDSSTSDNDKRGSTPDSSTLASAAAQERSDTSKKSGGETHKVEKKKKRKPKSRLHPEYEIIIKEYPFQPVVTEHGKYVNIILVRSPLRSQRQYEMIQRYKDVILFLGLSSFEDYPLPPANPFSPKFPADFYTGLFPGFLHMFRDTNIFPRHVKLLLMSQSDFALPSDREELPKQYDFTFSGSDQDVAQDCVGWSSFAKNWTFVKEALDVMCGEFGLRGVLVATKAKTGPKACSIPKSCEGKVIQTRFLDQSEYFRYLKQSRFSWIPQVHDASPRVTTQSLALNIPMFMNRNIMGGWKYLNEQTGEFFTDMSDFRESLKRLMQNLDTYTPRDYVFKNFGDVNSGRRLKQFIEVNFQDHVRLPKNTQILLPTGA